MSIKRWIARKLYPQVFHDADRYRYVSNCVNNLETWCFGHVPEVSAAASWIKRSERAYFMSDHEYYAAVQAGQHHEILEDISQLRERLKAMKSGLSYFGAGLVKAAIVSALDRQTGEREGRLHGRAWVAAEYRVTGSPHEHTASDSLAMARYILSCRPPAGQSLKPCPEEAKEELCCFPACNCAYERLPAAPRDADRAAGQGEVA